MLKIFRKKIVSRLILWGLLILILPAFVMWGSASMSRSKDKGPNYVGFIDNKKVSFDDLYEAISGVRSQIILGYFNQPKVLDALLGNKQLLAKLAWDRLIMLDEAKRLKIKVSDNEVIQTIRAHPLFIRDGSFDEKFYTYLLRNNIGLEPRAFEESVRRNISLKKLGELVTKDVKISDDEIMEEYKKESGEPFDEEKFKKDKEEYAKKAREKRVAVIMEPWLKDLESKAKLAISLEEIEKYYR